MDDTTILEKIGMVDAPEELQKETLQLIGNTVELRLLGLIEDLLSDVQLEEFKKMEKTSSKDEVIQWLSSIIGDMSELYNSVQQDYVEELIEQDVAADANDSVTEEDSEDVVSDDSK